MCLVAIGRVYNRGYIDNGYTYTTIYDSNCRMAISSGYLCPYNNLLVELYCGSNVLITAEIMGLSN